MTRTLQRTRPPAGTACALVPALRRPHTGDRAAVETMHARCSQESRTARWRAPLRQVPTGYLNDALSGRDGHLAMLAQCDRHGVVALASAVETAPGRWELGVLVDDPHQRRGIGSRLAATLIAAAQERGARQVVAEVGHDRRAVLDRLGAFGTVRMRPDRDGVAGMLDLTVCSGRETW